MTMDFLQFVEAARTCRRFYEDKPLNFEDLDWLLECARRTPSARNAQVLRYVELTGEAAKKAFPLTHWAQALKDWGGPFEGERPTAFLCVLVPDKEGELAAIDAGIACQTIQLAAHSKGWGCCIIKSFDHAAMASLIALPTGYKIICVLGLGYAKEERRIVPVPESGALSYYRDSANVHYVPKRSLTELVFARLS